MAYWLPEADGSIEKAYLYQGGKYIGEVANATKMAYNENRIEQTDEDREKMLHQQKRIAKFDKFIKEERKLIPNIGSMEAPQSAKHAEVEVELVETIQPGGYEEDEFSFSDVDWASRAIDSL